MLGIFNQRWCHLLDTFVASPLPYYLTSSVTALKWDSMPLNVATRCFSPSNMKQYRCRLVNYRLFNATVDGYRLGVHHEVSFLNTFCQYFSKYIPLHQNWLVTTYLILIHFHSTRWGIVKCLKKEFFFGCEPSSFLCWGLTRLRVLSLKTLTFATFLDSRHYSNKQMPTH